MLWGLVDNIRDKSKLLMGRNVVEVRYDLDKGVRVVCDDGEEFEGDVLVGCDGVNSLVRGRMWELVGVVEWEKESKLSGRNVREIEREELILVVGLFVDYNMLFGIVYGV